MPLSSDDSIQVVIGGSSFQDWLSVDLDSDIFSPADAWAVEAAVPTADVRSKFREGESCDVYVGTDRQMAGVIEDVEIVGSRAQTRLRVTGFDKGTYLVENEADAIKAANYTIQSLVKALLKPSFGIKNIVFENDDNRKLLLGKKDKKGVAASASFIFQAIPRKRTKIDPGQKIASVIDMHTKRLGVTWWLTAQGDLFLGKPNYKQAIAFSFLVADAGTPDATGNNVEEFSVKRSMGDRASVLQVNGQGIADKGGLFTSSSAAPKYKATANDPDLLSRGIDRRQLIADSDVLSKAEAQNRANLEQGKRQLGALVIKLTVPGYRQIGPSGENRLYTVDTLASVRIDEADINDTFYITQRRFLEERGKRRTEITLHEQGVWLP